MKMARLIPGACVTDSKGLHDKMQHTMNILKGKERRVDIECLALKDWRLPQPSFSGYTVERDGALCFLFVEWTTFEIDLRLH